MPNTTLVSQIATVAGRADRRTDTSARPITRGSRSTVQTSQLPVSRRFASARGHPYSVDAIEARLIASKSPFCGPPGLHTGSCLPMLSSRKVYPGYKQLQGGNPNQETVRATTFCGGTGLVHRGSGWQRQAPACRWFAHSPSAKPSALPLPPKYMAALGTDGAMKCSRTREGRQLDGAH